MSIEKKKYDCSALPKGWQREEVIRKSGLSAGKVDVYYYSPNGKKFRSKPQLARYLGDALDLATFDFRSGKINSLLLRKNKKQRGTQFDYSRGVRNDASLVPPIRQTASIFKQPVTVYKTQEGKVKTDFKHGPQEKPKQVKVDKQEKTVNVDKQKKTVNVDKQKKTVNVDKQKKTVNVGEQKKTVNRNKKKRFDKKKTVSFGEIQDNLTCNTIADNCVVDIIEGDIPLLDDFGMTGTLSTAEEIPSTSAPPMNEASYTQATGSMPWTPEHGTREECTNCSEHEQLKKNLLIKHYQLINYKTKLEIMVLEQKLGINESDFENGVI